MLAVVRNRLTANDKYPVWDCENVVPDSNEFVFKIQKIFWFFFSVSWNYIKFLTFISFNVINIFNIFNIFNVLKFLTFLTFNINIYL